MLNEGVSITSLLRILNILKDLSSIEDPTLARSKYPTFPSFAENIATLFFEDRLFDILPRLKMEIEIVRRYNPSVRPALDPYISSQIGILSRRFSDWEVGSFLDYPKCCIRSFAEEVRFGLDEKHFKELKQVKGKVFVTTFGFVPCSVFCEESHSRGLVSFLDKDEVDRLIFLEKDLSIALPHFNPEYRGHYYEFRQT